MLGSAHRRACGSSLALVAAIVALSAPSAGAATLTVGSPMNGGTTITQTHSGTATLANIALGESGANVTSPVTGTVVRWRATTTGTGQYSLRILRPTGNSQYTAVGSDTQAVSIAGAQTFSASLPIQAGDLLGVDIPTDGIAGIAGVQASGSSFAVWSPSMGSGPATPVQANDGLELYLNADVEYTPGSDPSGPPPGAAAKKCEKKLSKNPKRKPKKHKKHKGSASAAKMKCGKKH